MAIKITMKDDDSGAKIKMELDSEKTIAEVIDNAVGYWDKPSGEYIIKKKNSILPTDAKISDLGIKKGDILKLVFSAPVHDDKRTSDKFRGRPPKCPKCGGSDFIQITEDKYKCNDIKCGGFIERRQKKTASTDLIAPPTQITKPKDRPKKQEISPSSKYQEPSRKPPRPSKQTRPSQPTRKTSQKPSYHRQPIEPPKKDVPQSYHRQPVEPPKKDVPQSYHRQPVEPPKRDVPDNQTIHNAVFWLQENTGLDNPILQDSTKEKGKYILYFKDRNRKKCKVVIDRRYDQVIDYKPIE